jgi:hypothetical protein
MIDMKPLSPLVGFQGWCVTVESALSVNRNRSEDLDIRKLSI